MSPPLVRLLYCPIGRDRGSPVRPLEDRIPNLEVHTLKDSTDTPEQIETGSYDVVVGRCDSDIERGVSFLSALSAADSSLRTVLLSETYGDDGGRVPDGADIDGHVRIRDDADEITALASYLRNQISPEKAAATAGASGGARSEGEAGLAVHSDIDDSADQLESVARTTPDAILTIDEDSVVRFVNPAIEEVLGYSPEEVIGEPLTMLMSDALADEHRAAFGRYRETGVKRLAWDDIELPGRHADGHDVPLSISFSEFTRDGDQFFTGILRDVSERKEREAERELLHDVTRRIARAESFEEGIEIALREVGEAMNWVYGEAWVPDDEGDTLVRRDERYVAAETYAGFHERSRSVTFDSDVGLPGRVWESKEPTWIPDVTADSSSGFVRTDLAREHGLQAVLGVPIVADGEVIAVLVFALPEYREPDEGMIEATSGVAASLGRLMRRKRAEQALQEERDLKTRILETSPVGIVILDDDGEFEYVNDAAESILGLMGSDDGDLAYEDLEYQPLDDDGDPLEESERPYQRVKATGESYHGQLQVRRSDGDVRWLSVNGTPFESERGEVTKTIFAFEDVTGRKERKRELELSNQMLETVRDGVYALDGDGRFVSVNRAYADMVGYERERLLGEHATTVTSERANAELEAMQAELAESDGDAVTYETTIETAEGDSVPIEAHISLFSMGDGTDGRAGVIRDITARKRREEQLKQLNEFAQALTNARSATEACDIGVETANETLDLPITTIERYDEQSGRLEHVSRTPEVGDLVGSGELFGGDSDPAWTAYAEQRDRVLDDITERTELSDTTPLRSAIIVPIGTFGVFVSGSTEPNAFSTQDVTLANIFAANVEAAIERVDREEQLRDRKEELEEKTETLERVNRINSVIRDITQTLTHATTRGEIEQAICAKLANAEPYRFVWVGKQRTIGGEIEPQASAGVGRGYLDSITVTADDAETGLGPAGRAVETHEPQVQNNLHSDPPFEPWRVEALQRGYRASISVPLVNSETLYGTLNLYAETADVFDEMEVAVLDELGEMIGYAISAMERKKALVSGTSVEITLEIDDTSVPAIAFAEAADSRFEFEALVEQTGGSLRAFFTISGCTPKRAERYAETCPSVREMNLIAEREDGYFYEAVVGESSFFAELLESGAYPTALSAVPSGGRLTVELPRSGDIKAFLQTFTTRYDGVELVSRKELDRPVKTEEEFQALYEERLTEREEEVLRTAYYAGFFDFPRDSSASDVADILDVSQPTVSRHVRRGQQKMMDLVFDESPETDPER